MALEELKNIFDSNDKEFLKFKNIPTERKLSTRPDLNAFILLNSIIEGNSDMVSAAEHDEIFLSVNMEELLEKITEEQAIDLVRCGVRLSEYDCLAMFV